jgi:hypothetical protein
MTISSPVKGAFSGAEFAWREMSRRVSYPTNHPPRKEKWRMQSIGKSQAK